MDRTHSSAARPGVLSESLDSSLTVRAVSHPQKEKIDAPSPATNADSVSPVNGLNQSQEKDRPSGSSAPPAWVNAAIANHANTTNWKPTSTNWTFSVVVMPLKTTAVAAARNTRQVSTLTALFSHNA